MTIWRCKRARLHPPQSQHSSRPRGELPDSSPPRSNVYADRLVARLHLQVPPIRTSRPSTPPSFLCLDSPSRSRIVRIIMTSSQLPSRLKSINSIHTSVQTVPLQDTHRYLGASYPSSASPFLPCQPDLIHKNNQPTSKYKFSRPRIGTSRTYPPPTPPAPPSPSFTIMLACIHGNSPQKDFLVNANTL